MATQVGLLRKSLVWSVSLCSPSATLWRLEGISCKGVWLRLDRRQDVLAQSTSALLLPIGSNAAFCISTIGCRGGGGRIMFGRFFFLICLLRFL